MDKRIVSICAVLLFFVSFYASSSLVSSGPQSGTSDQSSGDSPAVERPLSGGEDQIQTQFKGPKTEECPINGQKLTKEEKELWERRRPLVAMIENHLDSRPQSGLSQADVIYEAVAEGGITRFAAVFFCKDAPLIGPVRSARVYFIDYASEYGEYPLYAHVGGANTPGPADALGNIRKMGWANYNDLNQFSIPFPYFFRDYERLPNRATEHTMYSSTSKLWTYAQEKRGLSNKDKKGNSWDDDFEKWEFKDGDPSSTPQTEDIKLDFWKGRSDYSVTWKYRKATNDYARSHASTAHIDKNTNKQLTAQNVVVLYSRESSANDGYPGGHLIYKTTGTGKGILFQDGIGVDINWQKKDQFARTIFKTTDGKEIQFNRGKIWVEIIPEGNVAAY